MNDSHTLDRPLSRQRALFAPLAANERWRDEWEHAAFREDVLAGLARVQKSIPPKYFYDAAGTVLFDRICDLPEYYPTRAELAILAERAPALARRLGSDVTLVELGSGNSAKTRLLLDNLATPRAYVPVDISDTSLASAAARLHKEYPGLLVLPVRADFTHSLPLPPAAAGGRRLLVFFPGSTVGNLAPDEAVVLLRKIHRRLGQDGVLLVGVDVPKDRVILERAYNDSQGITARFNRNLLERVRAELDTDIDPQSFEHHACWNEPMSRMEMHLRSRQAQQVRIEQRLFTFRGGETIHTENSYKYTPAAFAALAQRAGYTPGEVWQDAQKLFSVHVLMP